MDYRQRLFPKCKNPKKFSTFQMGFAFNYQRIVMKTGGDLRDDLTTKGTEREPTKYTELLFQYN